MQRIQHSTSPKLLEIVIILLLLALGIIFINFKMLQDGLNGMTDLRWHSLWIRHFSHHLAEGIWYPRWLSGLNYGYGSPTFVFYPPLVYYFSSSLIFFGFNVEQSIIFLFCFSLFLSGGFVYLYARSKFGIIPSLIGAIAYITAPYIAFNTYWVGSLSAAFGIAWIPLIFWLTEKSIINDKYRLALAISWTILALTHLPTLLLCIVIIIPHNLLYLLWRPWKIVFKNIFFIGLGLGLASFYLLPALLEKSLVNIRVMQKVGGGFQNMMFGSGTPLIPSKFDFSISQVFIQQMLAIILLGVLMSFTLRNYKILFLQARYWLIFSLILAFMMTSFSWPIWSISSTLQSLQAPWRSLSLFSFGEAILCTILVASMANNQLKVKLLIAITILFIILTNLGYVYKTSRIFTTFHNPGRANLEHLEPARKALFEGYTEKLEDVPEYRPLLRYASPSPDPLPNSPRFSIIDGKATIDLVKWSSDKRIFNIQAAEKSSINIRTYNYPAWHLYANGKLVPINTSNDGTIDFELLPGSYRVELIYQWTSAFMLGVISSLISLTILIYLTFREVSRSSSNAKVLSVVFCSVADAVGELYYKSTNLERIDLPMA